MVCSELSILRKDLGDRTKGEVKDLRDLGIKRSTTCGGKKPRFGRSRREGGTRDFSLLESMRKQDIGGKKGLEDHPPREERVGEDGSILIYQVIVSSSRLLSGGGD